MVFRLFPVSNQISQLNFNNEEGGIEYIKNYREYFVHMELTLLVMVSQNTLNNFLNFFFERDKGEINLSFARSRLEFIKIKYG